MKSCAAINHQNLRERTVLEEKGKGKERKTVTCVCVCVRHLPCVYMRKTPNLVFSIGLLSAALRLSPSTIRVSSGSMIPSSHRRALA